jgi:large subunit ribosomal protein L10
MKKAEKVFFVENLTAELTTAKTFVLVNFAGLGVKIQQELKKRLKAVGAEMIVVKNTLLKRAGEAAKIDKQILAETVLTGQTALIVSEGDPLAFIQVLGKFTQEFTVPAFKVGFVDGTFQDSEALAKLSLLPDRDVLLGQLLANLMAPSSNLVGTLQGNLQKLVSVLQTKAG